MQTWAESRFTGLFTLFVRVPLRHYDPRVAISAGEIPSWSAGEPELGCSGAGWTQDEADAACLGEGIERILARPLPNDVTLRCSYSNWSLSEPAIPPDHWGLFHHEQFSADGFPFHPLSSTTECRWTCCREAVGGQAVWVPEELVYLMPRPGETQRHTFGFSTGLSCSETADRAVLRGAQEVIERDALMGGWWGRYPVEEFPRDQVVELIGRQYWSLMDRRNLTFRFYRIVSPFSSHVTMVSVSGEDEEGWVFSVGSACRETRRESWLKSSLEAIQGRHCVRQLLENQQQKTSAAAGFPTTFFEHALFYSLYPDRLSNTILENASPAASDSKADQRETLRDLQRTLGSERPILFRCLTPPGIAGHFSNWIVYRVLIPRLQSLHGDHRLPFLGGPLWERPTADWQTILPHPFA